MVKRLMIGLAAVVLSFTFTVSHAPNVAVAAEEIPLLWSIEYINPDWFLCHNRDCDPTNPYLECCIAG